MNLEVIRFSSGTDSTNGILFETIQQGNEIDGIFKQKKFLAYTLEDEQRTKKFMEKLEYLMEHINWVLEKLVDIMQNILNAFLIFILVCFTCLTFLVLSTYLFTVEILMNTQQGVYLSGTHKKITKSRRTVL